MPSKYQITTGMAAETAGKITSDVSAYMRFLRTAANNYRYQFMEQLLIYAQKPDATACADIDTWNRIGRWVDKGTKGIALLVDQSSSYKLRYVFDVSNTNSRIGKGVWLWRMNPGYEEAIAEALQDSFGEVRNPEGFVDFLCRIAEITAEDNVTDYLNLLETEKRGSTLESMDDEELDEHFTKLLKNSVSFMVLSRCGYDASQYFSQQDFQSIRYFNTARSLSVFGSAVSDISEMILKEIGRTIRDIEKENRRIAKTEKTRYDAGENRKERSGEHGNDLQSTGRLSDSGSGSTGEPEDREVRDAAENLPEGTQKPGLHGDDDRRNAEITSGGNGQTGERDDGTPDGADESGEKRDGSAESRESDEVGSGNELDSQFSGGSDSLGTDLLVNLPTEQEQQDIISEAEAEKASAFSISQEEIDLVLIRGSGIDRGKYRIYEQYLKNESKAENITFLKNEYGTGGAYPAVPSRGLDEWHDAKGIRISRGRIGSPDDEVILSWAKTEKRIGELIHADRYLNAAEKDFYPTYRREEEARRKRGEIAEEFRSIIYDYNDFVEQNGEEDKKLNLYYLSGCWNAFSVGNRVMYARTIEGDLILPMMREAMNVIIADNTHLTERCEAMLVLLKSDVARPFEPTYDELNPPPEPEKEFVFALGETVYVGTKAYEIISFDEKEVLLADVEFPLFREPFVRSELEKKLRENPLNDRLLQVVERKESEEPEDEPELSLPERIAIFKKQVLAAFDGDTESIISATADEIAEETEDLKDPEKVKLFIELLKGLIEEDENFKLYEAAADLIIDLQKLLPEEIVEQEENEAPAANETSDNSIVLAEKDEIAEEEPVEKDKRVSGEKAEKPVNEVADVGESVPSESSEQEAGISSESADQKPYIDHYYVIDDLQAAPFHLQKFNDLDEALDSYFALPGDKRKAIGIQNTNDRPGSLDFIQCIDGEDRLTEDWLKTDGEGWQGPEILSVVEKLNRRLAERETVPELKPVRRSAKADGRKLYPEIPDAERLNYRIESDDIGVGTPLERFYNNIGAIRLLKTLEEERRLATKEEQSVLSNYVGWGGLSEFFEETNSHYFELKSLLTDEEYESARESTLTAFFTPPVVIRSIYKALENMNFRNGTVLEPSCGIGNFMGLIPDSMRDSRIYGVELDSISGRIAAQLYQRNSIAVQGYEEANLPDSFFDAAIGNVPFGQFKVPDKRYDRNNFLIHDYFFAKTLDKVRPGGVIAFITSKGTMDKENPAVRKYIAERAELLGAIRLPNNTFKDAAGTEVTSDILFLQKRDRLVSAEPDWVHLNTDENGIRMNQYFIDNPDMIMGEMKEISGPFGPETACMAFADQSLEEQLNAAVQNIHAEIEYAEVEELSEEEEEDLSIPADPDVRNFSYTVVDGKIYYRENSRMNPIDVSVTAEGRIKGMIAVRNAARKLIDYQTEDYSDEEIKDGQAELNRVYDEFVGRYGRINQRANSTVFSTDSSYCLLTSLEIMDDEGNFLRKADMFTKRTIKQKAVVTSVDTASEAYAVSLSEKARIDMPYMESLTGKSEEELFEDLKGVIFLNPMYTGDGSAEEKYLPADEYLSGNVREKLALAKRSAELYPEDYAENVKALEAVQPVDLTASEISVRLGATWLPPEIIQLFMLHVFDTPWYTGRSIHVHFSNYTGEWNIEGKSNDRGNIKANSTYGTSRINGYKILEETLNLKDVRIFDYIEDAEGRKTAILNKKETAIAQGKQELIKQAFTDWIWSDPERREKLTKLYNEKFNSIRPREYDGSHMTFTGINPAISLRPHQVNAIAHIIYGGNTLLAHMVGAGKTFEMVAASQECKRLGLCQKSLFVVPNHLTEQWASEYLQLYPAANILVATKKDFEAKNRKKFCGRIATGDYDAVIIGHSQFEKIPMSIERQREILEQQLDEIMEGIAELKHNRGDNFSIKQLERTKKSVKLKLDKLNDQSKKDDVVTFEELGVDRLFIDEAHYYKNLAAFTKMRNVGGISQTEAMKSSDLYMKCRYLDELTGGRGVIFATGTPISNSMVEMYTMQKYLQYGALKRNDLIHFDSWASTFGETVTAIELSPEGTGYRAKTRFAKFYNLPELMSMFKEVADIQTADMLKLPVPEAHYHNIVLKPSETQKEMVAALSERAEKVRNKMVDSSVDNMLLITNDGRKLALDQRLMNDMLPDSETGKVSACAENIYEIWKRTEEKKSTQLVFCDLSTPHHDGKFNVYDDLKKKLTEKGIPEEEIAYIHTAETETQKKELFGKVKSGQIRVLLGSTQKMGAGTNVQDKLAALHHLDCPWRPSDLQQREGRIIRQGNENAEVDIYTYVTEDTFDSYLYQLVESKQKFIGQIMTSKSPVRAAEDIDETALSYAEIKALCAGNPHIKEKMDLDIDVSRLKLLKANHLSQRYALEDQLIKDFPQKIKALEERITGYREDIAHVEVCTSPNEDGFSPMVLKGTTFTEKKDAGEQLLAICKSMTNPESIKIGTYRGFQMELSFNTFSRQYEVTLKNRLKHTVSLGTDIYGNILRLDNMLTGLPERLKSCEAQLENTRVQMENAKAEVGKPFPQEEELKEKTVRLNELNALLNLDKKDNEIVDGAEEPEGMPEKTERER